MTSTAPPVDGLDLDGLAALAEKATPGPWAADDFGELTARVDEFGSERLVHCSSAGDAWFSEPDAAYIAALSPDVVLRLIAAARLGEALDRSALERAGFEPDFNVCASCGHGGGSHDGGNWCLVCPRPDMPARPIDVRLKAGWCYFASMTTDEKWAHGIAALATALSEAK